MALSAGHPNVGHALLRRTKPSPLATIHRVAGISFDRAADYYDATRQLPAGVDARMTELLHSELSGRGRSLEIGVGTGRIALPLAARGVELIGADLSRTMLSRLVSNSGEERPVAVVAADVTELPLADASVDAVLGCHVLHLIERWQSALDEVRRVLRPGGVLLLDFGGPTPKPWSDACDAILRRHGVVRSRVGVSTPEPVAAYLEGRARLRALPTIQFPLDTRLADELADWENQILAWTWSYTPEQIQEACAEIRASAATEGWVLDEMVRVPSQVQWWAFDLLS